MAKPKGPLLSLGAGGSIADRLTFQKRGRQHIVRLKPIPKDPKSPAQLAWRQIYRDAVAAWHALTTEEKEAWRGVRPGLTAYQCFMSSELKYAPPPVPIDIGAEAIDRPDSWPSGYTIINKENPAEASGIITSVEIWAFSSLTICYAATFYLINGNTLKCRDTINIGNVTGGSKQTFDGLSLAGETGDYIGMYFGSGTMERHKSGYAGLWYKSGGHITPGDEATYTFLDGEAISLHGTGEAAS